MREKPTTTIVRCCLCAGMMRVAAKALSVFCPHCQKRVTLESLRIVGSHPGRTLATCGDILVESTSLLNLQITASNVVIKGRVNGDVIAEATVEVCATGRVIGDVRAKRIIVREGGVIQGHCVMAPPERAADDGAPEMPSIQTPAGAERTSASQEATHNPLPPPPRQIRTIKLD